MNPARLLIGLRVLGWVELCTLAAMLVNLATAHLPVLTKGLGPVHGLAYCGTVILALLIGSVLGTTQARRVRWLAAVPGIGGVLATRALSRAARRPRPSESH